jgi:hypothetical protein
LVLFNRNSLLRMLGVLLFLFLLTGGRGVVVYGQTADVTIESLAVDVWPEYDRPSVLVLLTGFLPAGTPLPATVTVPVPENADVTAVARIDQTGGLFADITFEESVEGQVTLTTPDPRFRVEYYVPFELEGDERSFVFEWESETPVTEMLVSVQQPVAAEGMVVDPAVFSVTTRADGFQYHNLSPVEVPAGERFSLEVSYSRAMTTLSAELAQPTTADETTTTTEQPEPAAPPAMNWQTILLASGGVAVLAVGVWMIFGERLLAARKGGVTARPTPKAARPRTREREMEGEVETAEIETPTYVQFCHHCGQKSDPDDRFCRSCGTRLKR